MARLSTYTPTYSYDVPSLVRLCFAWEETLFFQAGGESLVPHFSTHPKSIECLRHDQSVSLELPKFGSSYYGNLFSSIKCSRHDQSVSLELPKFGSSYYGNLFSSISF